MKKVILLLIVLSTPLYAAEPNLPPPGSAFPQDNNPITGSDVEVMGNSNSEALDTTPTENTGTETYNKDYVPPPTPLPDPNLPPPS